MGYPQSGYMGDMGALPTLARNILAKAAPTNAAAAKLLAPALAPTPTALPKLVQAVAAAKLPAPMIVKPPVVTPSIPVAVRPTPAPTPVLPPPPAVRDRTGLPGIVNAILKPQIIATQPAVVPPTPNAANTPVVVVPPPAGNGVTASKPLPALVDKLRVKAAKAQSSSLVARAKARAAAAKGDAKAAATYDVQAAQLQTVAQQAVAQQTAVPVYAPSSGGASVPDAMPLDTPADTVAAPASPLAKLSKNPLAMLAGGGLLLLVVSKMGGHRSWR